MFCLVACARRVFFYRLIAEFPKRAARYEESADDGH